MNLCYLCGKEFDDHNVKKHDEHIIQQAIGGSLTKRDILCLSCGDKLGKSIDVPFNEVFSGISTRLDIKKDRKANKKNAVKGKFISNHDQLGNEIGEIDVLWKDFKVAPVKPFHKYINEDKQVIVYADKKSLKSYKVILEREFLEKFDESNKPEIIICDDIGGVISYPLNMDNKIIKRGLAKIAVGFASKHGISRVELPLVLDTNIENGAIKDDIAVIPFYPLGVIDYDIEQEKNKFGYYPTHTLIIFTTKTNPKVLVCYIELFSTFQFYVILNDNYIGESIYEYYIQRVSKEDDYEFKPNRRHYKERDFILGDLGITEERITNAYNRQNSENKEKKSREQIEYEVIQEEYIKNKYSIDFEAEIKNNVDYIAQKKMELKRINGMDMDEMLNFMRNFALFEWMDGDDEIFDISSYRSHFIDKNKFCDYLSTLIEHRDKLTKNEDFKKYAHAKVSMLGEFIQNEGFKKKAP
ncbi:MAG: HNH endonuclease [Neobacillus sp.]|jgi:hypothetical protein